MPEANGAQTWPWPWPPPGLARTQGRGEGLSLTSGPDVLAFQLENKTESLDQPSPPPLPSPRPTPPTPLLPRGPEGLEERVEGQAFCGQPPPEPSRSAVPFRGRRPSREVARGLGVEPSGCGVHRARHQSGFPGAGTEDVAPSQAPKSSFAHQCPPEAPGTKGAGQTLAQPGVQAESGEGSAPPRLASATPSGAQPLQPGRRLPAAPAPPWTQQAVRGRRRGLPSQEVPRPQLAVCRCQGSDLARFQVDSEGA